MEKVRERKVEKSGREVEVGDRCGESQGEKWRSLRREMWIMLGRKVQKVGW